MEFETKDRAEEDMTEQDKEDQELLKALAANQKALAANQKALAANQKALAANPRLCHLAGMGTMKLHVSSGTPLPLFMSSFPF
jgi:uncharacterized protein (DUF3084 family)